ncbi:MAG: hypothetical protein MRJ65_13265 [Candidatus Brocadiaceae bacterium]|nr:hypothetical protein [Candidatus Brocadiaceae bacterium]
MRATKICDYLLDSSGIQIILDCGGNYGTQEIIHTGAVMRHIPVQASRFLQCADVSPQRITREFF